MCDSHTFINYRGNLPHLFEKKMHSWVTRKTRPFFFFWFSYTHTHTRSARKWNTCCWLWQWHHLSCGQSPVPLSGSELLTRCHSRCYRSRWHTQWHTRGRGRKGLYSRRRKDTIERWGIIGVIKDGSSLTASLILAASQISCSLLTLFSPLLVPFCCFPSFSL